MSFKAFPKRLSEIESFLVYCFFSVFYFKEKKIGFDWVKKHRKSGNERIYIFGSGYSLNDLSKKDWNSIRSTGDTLSFNEFYYSNFIKLDYYIFREVESKYFDFIPPKIRKRFNTIFYIKKIKEIYNIINNNVYMEKTKYFFLCEKKSGASLLYYMLYRKSLELHGFYSNYYDRTINWPISKTPQNIPHGKATLLDAINIAYLMGYKEIILAGVDLYDRNYFYLRKGETRGFDRKKGFSANDMHNTLKHIIDTLKLWKPDLKKHGVNIKLLNPKSLLNEVFDIQYLSKLI